MTKLRRLGIDVGGVIIDKANDGTDTSFLSDNFLMTTAIDQALKTITLLSREKFGPKNVFIVSKCGKKVEEKTRTWLKHRGFHAMTGVSEDQLHFCKERSGKAPISASLGITHFVDDKLEVLGYLTGIVDVRFLFRPEEREVLRHSGFLQGVTRVTSWEEIYKAV